MNIKSVKILSDVSAPGRRMTTVYMNFEGGNMVRASFHDAVRSDEDFEQEKDRQYAEALELFSLASISPDAAQAEVPSSPWDEDLRRSYADIFD